MSQSSELMRKYCDIIAVQEGIVRKAIKSVMSKPEVAAAKDAAVIGAIPAAVGTGMAADQLYPKTKPTAQSPQAQAQPQTQTGSSGRGTLGMPQVRSGEGTAVATGKGVQGTTTLAQGPKTADDLAHYSKGQFATRADRLDQAKVDSVLGAGRYRAGSAEANQALATHFRNQLVQQTFQDNLARSRADSERQQPRLDALALQDQEREVQRQELQFRQRDQQ